MFKNKRKILTYLLAFVLCVSCSLSAISLINPTFTRVSASDSANIKLIEEYLETGYSLQPQNEYQEKAKQRLIVYFTNLKENFHTLSGSEKTACIKNIKTTYYEYYNDFLYGDVEQSELIMSLGAIADPHVTALDYPYNFSNALTDLRNIRPHLSGVLMLGDLSEDGVSAYNEENSNLDDYYDFITNLNYANIDGEKIPFLNVMGNHDVRGPTADGYNEVHYQPAVDMYLEKEGVDSLFFDTWINGYHFIMLNTNKYERDDCTLSAACISWLDKTLSENEDGRPIFVLIHQYKDRVFTESNASYTFEEVIARHPSAIVLSGHNHYGFTTAPIEQEGKGHHVNLPTIQKSNVGTYNGPGYYVIDVYEEGVILRARLSREGKWVPEADVVVRNENYANSELFSADTADISTLTSQYVTIEKEDSLNSVSGKVLKIEAQNNQNATVVLPIMATATAESYGGYALYAESDKPIRIEVGNALLKANAPYFVLQGEIIQKTTGSNGEIDACGWIIIPKDTFDSNAYPNPYRYLNIYPSPSSTVYVDKIAYFYDINVFIDSIANITYSFEDALGNVFFTDTVMYGSELTIPNSPTKAEDQGFTYEFAGWDITGDGVADQIPATAKSKFRAVPLFTATPKVFTYTFVSPSNEVINTATGSYGSALTPPTVNDLLGWDLDGDGAIEGLPATINATVTAKAVLAGSEKDYCYTFSSTSGFIYKKGWVNAGESYILPQNPSSTNANEIFVGWDIDGDGSPDNLPELDSLTADLNATAVFYTLNTYQSYWQASMIGVTLFNATQSTGEHLELQVKEWADSPSGSAVVANWNAYGLNGENKAQLSSPYFTLPIPTDKNSTGFAIWVDTCDNDGYAFTLYKQNKAINTKSVYALSSNGELHELNTSSLITLPNAFKGWLVITTSAFGSSSALKDGQSLQILFSSKDAGSDTAKEIAFGSAIQFTDPVLTVIDSLSKNFFSFTDYNGEIISCGVLNKTTPLTIPSAPSRENTDYYTYEFIGWDVNGDGEVDSLPEYINTSIYAVAVYKTTAQQLTYKFVDENGNLLLEKTADFNTLILPLFNYKGDVDENHILKITYLDYEEGMRLTQNYTFTVKLEVVKKTFNYQFRVDGWVCAYGTVEFDQTVPCPEDPVKEGYEFLGWSNYNEDSVLYYDDVFEARFKEIEKQPEDSSSSDKEDEKSGCFGSISGGLGGLLAVLGVAVILKKKNK